MKKLFFGGVIGLLSLTACKMVQNLGQDEVIMYVAPEQVDCTGVAPMKCLQVKESVNEGWTYFYSTIEGFNYVPGYEYKLIVKKTKVEKPIPADASSLKYTFVKEIKKTKK